ncbi:sodium/solute symporter [candidate division KSB1 bacterium]|nr:sodium/solute symporter [candidate division KSB1 bacterium]
MQLTSWGIFIFCIYLVVVMGIGFYSGRKGGESKANYFLAGRGLPWYAIGFSLIAASISTEQFIGEVGWAYRHGLAVANWEWLCWPAQGLLLFFFLPLYLKNKIYTIPEFLRKRFNTLTGTTFSVILIVMYVVINLPLVLYSGGFVMNKIFGLNLFVGIWILALTAGAYTIYGGLSAAAWVDLFNGVLLLAGGLLVFVLGLKAVPGGFSAVIGTGERAQLMLPADHPDLPWTGMIAVAIVTSGFYYTTNQFITQKCLAAKSEWDGKMGIVLTAFLALPLALCVTWPGLIAYALNPALDHPDSAYPYLISTLIPVGLRGLMFAVLFGALMSTIDSLLSSTSSLVTLDIYKQVINKKASDRALVRFARIFGSLLLIFSALWSPMVGRFETIFAYVQECWALMMAPCMAVFILGIFWKRANSTAAVITFFSSLPMLILVFIREFYGILDGINIFNLSAFVFLFSLGFMILVSYVTKPSGEENTTTTIWHPSVLGFSAQQSSAHFPLYKRIAFWWTIVVMLFVIIYIKYW